MAAYRRADNKATRKPTRLKQRFYHAPGRVSWRSDSPSGIRQAAVKGWPNIDVNMLKTRDGVSIGAHWMRPLRHGWVDPKGQLRRDAKLDQITYKTAARLKPRKAPSVRIDTIETLLAVAAKHKIGVELEAKNAQWTQEQADALKDLVDRLGVQVIVKTLSTNSHALHNLTVFHRAGFTTVLLPRGTRRIPRSWWPHVDKVRGPVIWTTPKGAKK